jgi:hypothetical protein
MRTMGHKDVKTAMQYQHPELEIVRRALNLDNSVAKQVAIKTATAHRKNRNLASD